VSNLSVVIASYRAQGTIEACLGSLEKQSRRVFEIIVVDSGLDGTAEIVARNFPHVRLLASAERKYPGDARNIGVRHSSGEIIAFLDADCVADVNWAREILLAHQEPDPVVGGAIDNANPESYVGWAAYFCALSQWMPGGEPRHMTEVPTGCLSLKRWAFERFGPFLEGTYCSDTAFNWRAGPDGFPPLFCPSIRVFHMNFSKLSRFLPKQVMHGRAFATVRMREQRLPRWKTAVLGLGSPLLPFLLFARILERVLRNRRYLRRFVTASPMVLLGLAAWSWGECAGYWTGLMALIRLSATPQSAEPSA